MIRAPLTPGRGRLAANRQTNERLPEARQPGRDGQTLRAGAPRSGPRRRPQGRTAPAAPDDTEPFRGPGALWCTAPARPAAAFLRQEVRLTNTVKSEMS
jgi:hypothetical protein